MLNEDILMEKPGTPLEAPGIVVTPTDEQMAAYWRGERLPRYDLGWGAVDFGLLESNLVLVSGYANHGKGTMVRQIALQMYFKYGIKWAFWSPEDMPEEYFYGDIIHMIKGKSTERKHSNYISSKEYFDGFKVAKDAIKLIDFEDDIPSVKKIFDQFDYLHKQGIRGFVLDPFNNSEDANLDTSYDKIIREVGLYLRKWARDRKNVFPIIVTHPKTPSGTKTGEDTKLPSSNDLHYGTDWAKIFDDIIMYHHPTYNTDKDNITRIISLAKVKKAKISGKRTDYTVNWNWMTDRITDMYNKCGLPEIEGSEPCPLKPHAQIEIKTSPF